MRKTILLRKLKFCWTDLKIILLDHQNNFVENNERCCKKFWYSSN